MQKTKGQSEAEISQALVQFEKDFMGRGPTSCKAYMIDDIILVRLKGVLTSAEQHLSKNQEGSQLIKRVRANLLENARGLLVEAIEQVVTAKVVSLHTDISTKTGERVIIFTLTKNLEDLYPDFST
jgi:uncharacterized protein YbcI